MKKKTLHKELVKIARAKRIDSPGIQKNLAIIYQVCKENVGEPILIGEKNSYFRIGIINKKSYDHCIKSEYYIGGTQRHQLSLPIGRHVTNRDSWEGCETSESQIIMEWDKNYIFFRGEKREDHFRLINREEYSSLEVLIGTKLIEKNMRPDIHNTDMNYYLGQMNALGLKPTTEAQRQVFEGLFKNYLGVTQKSQIEIYLKQLENMGLDKADIITEPITGVKVNPKIFYEGINLKTN